MTLRATKRPAFRQGNHVSGFPERFVLWRTRKDERCKEMFRKAYSSLAPGGISHLVKESHPEFEFVMKVPTPLVWNNCLFQPIQRPGETCQPENQQYHNRANRDEKVSAVKGQVCS